MRTGGIFKLPGGPTRGSSLLGLSILLFGLSIAFAFALPAFERAQRTARARAVLADLQQFEKVFQQYAHDHGDWPPGATGPGAIPPGMEAALGSTHWRQTTPIGGHYIWFINVVAAGMRPRAAIAIASTADEPVSDDKRQLDALTREVAATRLPAHRLRLGFRDEPVYALEP